MQHLEPAMITHPDLPQHREDPERNRAVLLVALEHTSSTKLHGDAAYWRAFLSWSAHPDSLETLDTVQRHTWAALCARLLRLLPYTVSDLFADRAEELASRVFLEAPSEQRRISYAEAWLRARHLAAALRAVRPDARVLLMCANSIESALIDLACLAHGILVAPLSTHSSAEEAKWVMRRLGITIAIGDSVERVTLLRNAAEEQHPAPLVLATRPDGLEAGKDVRFLDAVLAEYGQHAHEAAPVDMLSTATVMFTSGSTGQPKGVCFSQWAMLSKRFARAAALPAVGRDETLLCYLPLFHTFGRFLELQGMLFWRGRYVFARDGSREALLEGLRTVRPTGLIGVPLRWSQLRDAALRRMEGKSMDEARELFRAVSGGALRWGLSAAGYLDPAVFRFFHEAGVELCSGFGMTEATGGITMTPPGAYQEHSVGIPLPLLEARLGDRDELLIRGSYVAATLPEQGALPMIDAEQPAWFATGDIFRVQDGGHFEIIDRIKDIYKNSKGQTVSPLAIEQQFRDVPAIKRVFIAGDGREYNVALMVPDTEHPLFTPAHDDGEREAYVNEIVRTVNARLAPFERIVRYALLERDFDAASGEVTPKGSYNRRSIAEAFSAVIEGLYQDRTLTPSVRGLQLIIPLWLLRAMGITANELVAEREGLRNRASGMLLPVRCGRDAHSWVVGDVEYVAMDARIDVGTLCRQPRGWMGNAALAAFFPCREGWDASHVGLPPLRAAEAAADALAVLPEAAQFSTLSPRVLRVHALLARILTAPAEAVLQLLDDVGAELEGAGSHLAQVLRSRLAALAWHADERVRSGAYLTLLLCDPLPEDGEPYAEFVHAGRSFLTEASISAIAERDVRHGRLAALRARLRAYRESDDLTLQRNVALTESIIALLARLAESTVDAVYEVRAELCAWLLHDREHGGDGGPALRAFFALKEHYTRLYTRVSRDAAVAEQLPRTLRFEAGIDDALRERLGALLARTPFLSLSLLMIHRLPALDCRRIADGGLWITLLPSQGSSRRFLANVRTKEGQHYPFQIILDAGLMHDAVLDSLQRFIALAGAVRGPRVLPRFGSFMPEHGAVSLHYVDALSVWDALRGAVACATADRMDAARLHTSLVEGMAAFIIAWEQSGRRMLPGRVHPANVAVPSDCLRSRAMILDIEGWRSTHSAVELLGELATHFIEMLGAQFPEHADQLDAGWLYDAAREALGDVEAERVLLAAVEALPLDRAALRERLLERLREHHAAWIPTLAVQRVIACFREWDARHPQRAAATRHAHVRELLRVHELEQAAPIQRYAVYRHTLFADADEAVRTAFDALLRDMHRRDDVQPMRLPAMAQLQDALREEEQREALLHLVAPLADAGRHALRPVAGRPVLVRRLRAGDGAELSLREATRASEIGALYDLFLRERFPMLMVENMQYIVVEDAWKRILGGAGYVLRAPELISMEMLIVDESLRGQGVGRAILEDVLRRAREAGVPLLRAPHYLRAFCLRQGWYEDADHGDVRRAVE